MPETQSEALIQKAEYLISEARKIITSAPLKTRFVSTYLDTAGDTLKKAADAYDRETR